MIVVEHDEETIREADHLIDPAGAGKHGGEVIAAGSVQDDGQSGVDHRGVSDRLPSCGRTAEAASPRSVTGAHRARRP